ncbi:hypothetical protein M407DRAFT_7090 [Tulasnella calospora MUT 4182]|uniref:Uncharacterized protein n=1 Tax=Tulasnella calospora MUT 4182 TaxID=1051891 RepID=A0A0C3QKI6_9AGAM|nr:hypothetical protein M407DRAFT_7090 [Tulasnella calospora MUT 4182]
MKVAVALSALAFAHSALVGTVQSLPFPNNAIAEYYQCGGYEGITGDCDAGNVFIPPPSVRNIDSKFAIQAWFALSKILTTSTSRGPNYYWQWFVADNDHHHYFADNHYHVADYLEDHHHHHHHHHDVADYFEDIDHHVQHIDDFEHDHKDNHHHH